MMEAQPVLMRHNAVRMRPRHDARVADEVPPPFGVLHNNDGVAEFGPPPVNNARIGQVDPIIPVDHDALGPEVGPAQ